jgi:hypothetical protein
VPVHQLPSSLLYLFCKLEGKEREGGEDNKPLYLIVSKFKPTRFGSRKSLRVASHVPSPTYMVFELYVLLPGGERLSWGAIVAAKELCSGAHPLRPAAALVNSLFGPLDRTMYCVQFAMNRLLSIAVGMRSVERNGCCSRAPSGVCCQSRLTLSSPSGEPYQPSKQCPKLLSVTQQRPLPSRTRFRVRYANAVVVKKREK